MYWFFVYWLLSGIPMAYWAYRDYDNIIEEFPVLEIIGKKALVVSQGLVGFISFPWVVVSKIRFRYLKYSLRKKEAENKKLWQKYFIVRLNRDQRAVIGGIAKELNISEQEVQYIFTELGMMMCVIASNVDEIGNTMNNLNNYGNEYRNLLKIIELQYKYYKAGEENKHHEHRQRS